MSSEQMFWLEASTFSNRGEMRQHLPTDYGHTPYSWLEASTKTLTAHHSPLSDSDKPLAIAIAFAIAIV